MVRPMFGKSFSDQAKLGAARIALGLGIVITLGSMYFTGITSVPSVMLAIALLFGGVAFLKNPNRWGKNESGQDPLPKSRFIKPLVLICVIVFAFFWIDWALGEYASAFAL